MVVVGVVVVGSIVVVVVGVVVVDSVVVVDGVVVVDSVVVVVGVVVVGSVVVVVVDVVVTEDEVELFADDEVKVVVALDNGIGIVPHIHINKNVCNLILDLCHHRTFMSSSVIFLKQI